MEEKKNKKRHFEPVLNMNSEHAVISTPLNKQLKMVEIIPAKMNEARAI